MGLILKSEPQYQTFDYVYGIWQYMVTGLNQDDIRKVERHACNMYID